MWSLPLDPPPTAIPLSDPLVEVLGTGKLLTRDLFFSGHTSFMFLMYLVCNTKLRPFFLLSTLLVGVCVLLQHVHYTVDVLVAPFVAYGSFRLMKEIPNWGIFRRATGWHPKGIIGSWQWFYFGVIPSRTSSNSMHRQIVDDLWKYELVKMHGGFPKFPAARYLQGLRVDSNRWHPKIQSFVISCTKL